MLWRSFRWLDELYRTLEELYRLIGLWQNCRGSYSLSYRGLWMSYIATGHCRSCRWLLEELQRAFIGAVEGSGRAVQMFWRRCRGLPEELYKAMYPVGALERRGLWRSCEGLLEDPFTDPPEPRLPMYSHLQLLQKSPLLLLQSSLLLLQSPLASAAPLRALDSSFRALYSSSKALYSYSICVTRCHCFQSFQYN